MIYSGLGSGISGDPYQITTVNEFLEIDGFVNYNTVFSGTGTNDLGIDFVNGYQGNGTNSYTFIINQVHGIKTSTLNLGGSGYTVNDTFTVNGGTAGLLATGKVTGVNSGAVTTYTILTYGSGYSIGNNILTTYTSGSGSGFNINITALQADTFTYLVGSTEYTTPIVITSFDQYLYPNGEPIGFYPKFTKTTGHTVGDQWVVNFNGNYYFKLMNNIDYSGQTTFNIFTLCGHLDGNGFTLLNLPIGVGGIGLKDGSSVSNLTFIFNRQTPSQTTNTLFNTQSRNLDRVSILNLHVIATGTTFISISADNWNVTSTISHFVIEGNINSVFSGTISCLIEHVKLYRNYLITQPQNLSIVNGLHSIMRYCQNITPFSSFTVDQEVSYLVSQINSGATIQECFVLANINATIATNISSMEGFIASVNGSAATMLIKDSYFIGNININNIGPSLNPSGFIINNNSTLPIQRCYFLGDINTPLVNNRAVFCKETNTSSPIVNCYYNKNKLTSINTVDYSGKQSGLTSTQFTGNTNYNGWDFTNIWNMTPNGPVLRNNPEYNFTLNTNLVLINSLTRNSSTQITVVLNVVPNVYNYGIDIYDHLLNLIYSSGNTINNIVVVNGTYDQLYTLKTYYLNSGNTKVYISTTTYQHYCLDSAVMTPTQVTPSTIIMNLTGAVNANFVHGSCIYGNYIYGSTRNLTTPFPTQTGCIVKAPLSGITNYQIIPIYFTSEGVGQSANMDQIVACGNYLYAMGEISIGGGQSNVTLLQFNPIDNSYKVFLLSLSIFYNEPIITDGIYLYLTYNSHTYKVDPEQFIGDYPKFNTSGIFSYTPIATYDHSLQGGAILGGYDVNGKGYIHTAQVDENYLYLNFSTKGSIGDINSYDTVLGSLHELHKVNKNTMLPAGWIHVPVCTDDSCQTTDYCFFGCEIEPTGNPLVLGWGVGAYAVRKSDLNYTCIPKLHSLDNPPYNQSYGSLLFGNYLIDQRTNGYMAVLDISDVDNWLFTEPAGKRTLGYYQYLGLQGEVLNELLLSTQNKFYAFIWAAPSGLVELQLSGFTWYSPPIVSNLGFTITGDTVTLTGYKLLSPGSMPILTTGFKYGTSSNNLNKTILSTTGATTFQSTISGLTGGTYYFKAFATNSTGEGDASILSFDLNGTNIYIGSNVILAIYIGTSSITSTYFNNLLI